MGNYLWSSTTLTEEEKKIRKEKIMYMYNHKSNIAILKSETSSWLHKFDKDLIFLAFKVEVLNVGTRDEKLEAIKIRDHILLQKPQDDDDNCALFIANCFALNFKKAFEFAYEGVKKNHPNSLYHIGWCFLNGKGCDASLDLAIKYLELSIANNGPAPAYYELAIIKESKGNREEATKLLYKAVELGYLPSIMKLGLDFQNDVTTKESFLFHQTVFKYNKDQPIGQYLYNLGQFYFYGRIVDKDYKIARNIWQLGADTHNVECMKAITYMNDNEF